MARIKKTPARRPAPSIDKNRVLAVLAENPQATKRDLVRLMGVKGADRIVLKRTLKDLEGEGIIAGTRRRGYAKPGTLPHITVLEVTGPDEDGDLTARPLSWTASETGEDAPPKIFVRLEAGANLGPGERILARLERHGESYDASIIRKLGKTAGAVLGVVRIENGHARVVPVDRKGKGKIEYAVETQDLMAAEHNELVQITALPGRRIAGFPRAKVTARHGSLNAPKSISLISIHQHGIPAEFPDEVIDEARKAKPVDALGARTDLRSLPLVTIDPVDARDFDDAVWAGPDAEGGGFTVIVAIADVSHYVTPGSKLDREAFKRGNSVYFPDRVVPMLPEELSNDLCSLKPDVDRPCMAARMHFDAEGKLRETKFLRALMRSAARLTYAQAQAAFDGDMSEIPQPARAALKDLWTSYQVLARARETRAPLALDVPERQILIDAAGHVSTIAFKERLESMRLIEECMVMANVAAAEVLEKHRQGLIYRVHETPSPEKLNAFAEFLRSLDIPFARGQVIKPAVFNRILERSAGGTNAQAMNDIVLRTQAQAIYDSVNIGHFGLNLAKYAHFTSPIRRYADVVVHRALIRALKLGEDGLTDSETAKLALTAEHISTTERRAMEAERDCTDRYVAAYMADRVGAVFTGKIATVTRFGLFVRLAETGADGLLPARALGTDYYRYDERQQALIGERSGVVFRMGDEITVALAEADALSGGLRFDLAQAPGDARSHRRTSGPRHTARQGTGKPAGTKPDRKAGNGKSGSRAARRRRKTD